MNSKKFTLIMAAVAIFLCGNLNAAYTGLSAEVVASDAITGYTTYRIYANFDDVNDQVISVYGFDTEPIHINSTGDFYQDVFGGAYANLINPAFYGVAPSLQYDSWLAIGGEDNSSPSPNSVGLDVSAFEAGGNLLVNDPTGGSWFILPGTEPLAYATTGQVLLAQLTTNGDLDILFNVQWRDALDVNNQEVGETLLETFELYGCTDPAADNYDASFTADDGSCTYPAPSFVDLSYELVGVGTVPGYNTYRVYANFTNVNDQVVTVYGQDTSPLTLSTTGTFYQNALGGPTSSSINTALFGTDPDLAYDSWVTIGTEASPNGLNTLGADFTAFEAGGALTINDVFGGGWFVLPDSEPTAFPDGSGRVLLGQVTTDGIVTFTSNIQYRAQDGNSYIENPTIVFPDDLPGCTNSAACNYNTAATTDDGSCILPTGCETCSGETDGTGTVVDNDADNDGVCDADEIVGCQDNTACNYNAAATDAGSCTFPTGCETCSGETDGTGTVVDNDADNDGVCDADEIVGCQDNTACNYNAAATDAGACTFPTGCETCSGETDGTGTVVDNDADNDGVCDADEIVGCQDNTACNYNAAATDAGACTFPTGCETCSGATDGTGTVVDNDVDNDGVCDADEIAGCQDNTACNFNAAATDADTCIFPTGCETCSGATDGTGTVVDNDADNDGVCDADEIVGCQDMTACNYNVAATDAGTCIFPVGCETCSGATDGTGTVVDNDADNDGVCDADEIPGCQDVAACNYNSAATDPGACTFPTGCETCSGETDGTGTVVDNDADNDGVCDADEIVGCQDNTACNYNAAATDAGACTFPTGCETCSGATDGTGTVVDNDADNDGVCDADEIVGCQDMLACNYNSAATDAGACTFATGCETCSGETDGTGTVIDNDADNDGVCDADEIPGCQSPAACNYNPAATDDDGSCTVEDECGVCGGTGTAGCTDPTADNYDSTAACDDGSCIVAGCTYSFAFNYNPAATYDDGSCIESIDGCTDTSALNYDGAANTDDGSCEYTTLGCTDCSAENYDAAANTDDGSCTYLTPCLGDFNYDGIITAADLTQFLGVFGTLCE